MKLYAVATRTLLPVNGSAPRNIGNPLRRSKLAEMAAQKKVVLDADSLQ